jgi:hypothetical protein
MKSDFTNFAQRAKAAAINALDKRTPEDPAKDALHCILALIGNVRHGETGGGHNAAQMRGCMMDDIRTIAERALEQEEIPNG